MLTHAPACGKIPRHALASIRQAGPAWQRFLEIWDALLSPESDLLIEDFGPVYARFRQLQNIGVPFADSFIQRIEQIRQTCFNRDDDADEDGQDALIDLERDDDEPDDEDGHDQNTM